VRPMPLLAPVITYVRPRWSGRSLVLQDDVMNHNVDNDNNAVNAYILVGCAP
jgi:hypothetical protein